MLQPTWKSYKRVMERWSLDKLELDWIIDNGLLLVFVDHNYDPKYHPEILNPIPVKSLDFADYNPDQLFFKLMDVIRFEEKHADIIERMGMGSKRLSTTQNVPKRSPSEGFKNKSLVNLMNQARPEIELIYKAIKEGEGFKNIGQKYHDSRMQDALNYFEEYKDKFKIIKEEDLQNKKIFEISTEKHTRKVKGELLKTIVKRHGLGDYAYGGLFKEYQKNK